MGVSYKCILLSDEIGVLFLLQCGPFCNSSSPSTQYASPSPRDTLQDHATTPSPCTPNAHHAVHSVHQPTCLLRTYAPRYTSTLSLPSCHPSTQKTYTLSTLVERYRRVDRCGSLSSSGRPRLRVWRTTSKTRTLTRFFLISRGWRPGGVLFVILGVWCMHVRLFFFLGSLERKGWKSAGVRTSSWKRGMMNIDIVVADGMQPTARHT